MFNTVTNNVTLKKKIMYATIKRKQHEYVKNIK